MAFAMNIALASLFLFHNNLLSDAGTHHPPSPSRYSSLISDVRVDFLSGPMVSIYAVICPACFREDVARS